jgi:COP9 signalosome complex subunit 8
MTGPPTPPPSSETELLDQARTDAIAPAPPAAATSAPAATPQTSQTKQPPQDVYHFVLPKLASLAAQSDYSELIRVAEHADLNAGYSYCVRDMLLTSLLCVV